MKFNTLRASCFGLRAANSVSQAGLATTETVSPAAHSRRAARSLHRGLVSLLSLVLGLAATAVHAQDAEKKDEKKEEKPAAAAGQQPPAPSPAAPAAPAGPAPGTVTVTGLIDGYYQINYQHPRALPSFAGPTTGLGGTTTNGINATRAFDYRDNFGLSLGELNITRTAGKGFPLGFTGTFTVGDTPPVVYANEPGGRSGFEGIQQLYLTYTPHIFGRDVAIDFGKFVTPLGYEVIESSSNDNYSRGLVFTYGVPLYHTGFRFAAPLAKTVNFLGGVVTGWNSSTDDNGALTEFAQLVWTPGPHFTGTLGFIGGSEGHGAYGALVPSGGAGNITTNLIEFIPVFNATSKLKFAADFVYASAAGDVRGAHVSGNWLGMAGYVRYQWTPQIATAIRAEQFEDMPGVGALPGATAGGLRFAAGYAKVRSFTATLEYAAFHGHLISRLEYRHDRANQPFGAIGPDQDTLTLGEVYKF